MSFYKMPPPWDPGYAIPKYVQAEPPQRGTFTTQWLPRGTIPALIPDYLAVPQRAGSSLAVTTLSGTCFDHTSLSGTSLSGDSLGASASEYDTAPGNSGQARFNAYGQKVAKGLMARMERLPQKDRGPTLKKALAAIDKTLPARAEALAKAEMKRGAPPKAALARGIAAAVSQGVVGELASIGRRARVLPQARPLRGLGLSHMALGATSSPFASATVRTRETETKATATPPPPTVGQCSPDGTLIWRAGGYWERKRASETCTSTYAYYSSTTATGPAGGVTVTDSDGNVVTTTTPKPAPVPSADQVPMIQVGPFMFPKDATYSSYRWHAGANGGAHYLPEAWQAEIRRLFSSSLAGSSMISTSGYQLDKFVSGLPANVGNGFLFLANSALIAGTQQLGAGNKPIFRAKHPVTGEDYGVFIGTGYSPTNVPIKDAQATLYIVWAKITNPSWYVDVWNFIKNIVVTIVDVVADAVNAVKDTTCALLTTPGIEQAAIGAAAGDPSLTSAGLAAGVVVGQQLCGGAQQPQPQQQQQSSGGSWLLPAAAVGGGLLLVYALTQR